MESCTLVLPGILHTCISFTLTLCDEVPLGCKGTCTVVANNRDVIAALLREGVGQGIGVGCVAGHSSWAGLMPGEDGIRWDLGMEEVIIYSIGCSIAW